MKIPHQTRADSAGLSPTGHSYMTIYFACNGAQVFSTGTFQWTWGLDDFAKEITDPRIHPAAQQMTHNVFRTFSGQANAPVVFTNADSITSGNWTNVYGAYYMIADATTLAKQFKFL